MQLPLQKPLQQQLLVELVHSQQLVRPEEYQIGRLAVEVIKLCKEAEVVKLEALAMDKELQISLLLDKLDLGPLGDLGLPQPVETSQGCPNRPNNSNQHNNNSNSSPNRHQPLQRHPQLASCQQHCRDNQQDH